MKNSNLIIRAAQAADSWHKGQLRKHTKRPYIEHPGRVAARISRHIDATEEAVAAAWLHDVMEDCAVTEETLIDLYGSDVAVMVHMLTNVTRGSPLPREQRKALDRQALADAPHIVRLIKLADRTDNLREMPPDKFAALYCAESRALLEALKPADRQIEAELYDAILALEVQILTTLPKGTP